MYINRNERNSLKRAHSTKKPNNQPINEIYIENEFIHKLRQSLQSIQLIKDLLGEHLREATIVDYSEQLGRAIKELSNTIDNELNKTHSYDIFDNTSKDTEVETNINFLSNILLDRANIPDNNFKMIYVVDDDKDLLNNLRSLFERHHYRVATFSNATEFLEVIEHDDEGFLLVDQRLPGISGTDIIKILRKKNIRLNAILMTGFGDISLAISAFKAGAVDFIEKPFRGSDLLHLIADINKFHKSNQSLSENGPNYDNDIAKLTPREQQVLKFVLAGHASKNIAADLGTSQRTIENHRASIMRKLKCRSIAMLVRRMYRPN